LCERARDAATAAGLDVVCRNPFKSIVARSVELVEACEEALRLIAEYRTPERPAVDVTVGAAIGYGCSEAPRGLLYHRYTLDEKGLKLVWLHSYVDIRPDSVSYDPGLREAVELLRGREVLLSLTIRGGKRSDPSYDNRVVPVLREIADLAATTGQRVVLYPHAGDWVEKIGDAVRVAHKVDRPNLGAMFNLYHWLRVEYPDRLEEALEKAMPHLFAVSITGSDPPSAGQGTANQPLGSGSFDVAGLLRALHRLGYKGPIGLFCWGIGGDAEVHLKQSMAAWRRLAVEAVAEPPQ
jgi:sugar phosphate isomerase/epimerase